MANEIASNIKAFRKNQGLSQSELAGLLGVSQSAVFYWETGKREPNTATILRLCDIFHITLAELYGQKEVEEDKSEYDFKKACEWLEEADYTIYQDEDEQNGFYEIQSFDEGTVCRMNEADIVNFVRACVDKANEYCDPLIQTIEAHRKSIEAHRDQLIVDFIKIDIQQQK